MSCLHPFQSYVWAFGEILGCPGENTIKTNEDLKKGYGIISNARWRHQMETFSALPPLCVGIFRVTAPLCGDFPRYRPFVWGFHHPPPHPPTPPPTPPPPHPPTPPPTPPPPHPPTHPTPHPPTPPPTPIGQWHGALMFFIYTWINRWAMETLVIWDTIALIMTSLW